jgi:hypothetical protein
VFECGEIAKLFYRNKVQLKPCRHNRRNRALGFLVVQDGTRRLSRDVRREGI